MTWSEPDEPQQPLAGTLSDTPQLIDSSTGLSSSASERRLKALNAGKETIQLLLLQGIFRFILLWKQQGGFNYIFSLPKAT